MFQVSAEQEASAVVTAIPWATTITQINSKGRAPLEAPAPPAATARFVFLSRISPKKNLLLALRAARALSSPAVLDIYGNIEDSTYWRLCEEEIRQNRGPTEIAYRGPLPHDLVHETLAQYDALVLPTHGENFGHVILESLSVGCAVVTSPHTPWSSVLQSGGGTVVAGMSTEEWTEALAAIVNTHQAQRMALKQATLDAYRAWRDRVDDTLAVETLLGSASE